MLKKILIKYFVQHHFLMIEIEIVKTISLLSGVTDNVGFVWPVGAIVQDVELTHAQ